MSFIRIPHFLALVVSLDKLTSDGGAAAAQFHYRRYICVS